MVGEKKNRFTLHGIYRTARLSAQLLLEERKGRRGGRQGG